MSSSQEHEFESPLDAYLDGLMDGPEREQFERALEDQPELRHQIKLEHEIDEQIRAMFYPPAAPPQLAGAEPLASDGPGTQPAPRLKPPFWTARNAIAMAACVALLAYCGYVAFNSLKPPPRRQIVYRTNESPMTFAAIYRQSVAEGFQPLWKCESDKEFRETFENRLGQGLVLASASLRSGDAMLGLSYWYTDISRDTVCMLATADDKPVMVFVDRADRPQPAPVDADDLHLFTRRIENLALYELTPLDQPRMLEAFH